MIVSDFDAMKPALVGLVGTGMSMGGPVGLPVLIEAVQQDERRKKLGLDALVACYLDSAWAGRAGPGRESVSEKSACRIHAHLFDDHGAAFSRR